MSKHATVKIGEFTVPLIGVKPSATQETCSKCNKVKHLSEISFDGTRFICRECTDQPAKDMGGV